MSVLPPSTLKSAAGSGWLQILYGDPLRADGLSSTWVNNPLQITDRLWVPFTPHKFARVMHNEASSVYLSFRPWLGLSLCSLVGSLDSHTSFPSSASVFPPVKGLRSTTPSDPSSGDTVDVDSVFILPKDVFLPPVCFLFWRFGFSVLFCFAGLSPVLYGQILLLFKGNSLGLLIF